jgi:pimeloyl-ACP methyl ester carboxylesterase
LSDGERGVVSKERVREDFAGALEAMKTEYGVDPDRVVLLGHSAGGGMAVCTAPLFPQVKVLIALAPIARLKDEMNAFEFIGYNVMRAVNAPVRIFKDEGVRVPYKIDYKRLYASQDRIERARKDAFLQTTIPVKNYKALVKQLDATKCAKEVKVPTLVAVAEYDVVVGKHNSRRVFDALAGPKKWMEVPKSGHSMCGDVRSDFVAKIVLEFIQERLLGVPVP